MRGLSSRRTPVGAKRPRAPACRAARLPGVPVPGSLARASAGARRGATGTPAPALRPKGDARGARRGAPRCRVDAAVGPPGPRPGSCGARSAHASASSASRVSARAVCSSVSSMSSSSPDKTRPTPARAPSKRRRVHASSEPNGEAPPPPPSPRAGADAVPAAEDVCRVPLPYIASSPFQSSAFRRGGAKNGGLPPTAGGPHRGPGAPPRTGPVRLAPPASPRPARTRNEAASAAAAPAAAAAGVSAISAGSPARLEPERERAFRRRDRERRRPRRPAAGASAAPGARRSPPLNPGASPWEESPPPPPPPPPMPTGPRRRARGAGSTASGERAAPELRERARSSRGAWPRTRALERALERPARIVPSASLHSGVATPDARRAHRRARRHSPGRRLPQPRRRLQASPHRVASPHSRRTAVLEVASCANTPASADVSSRRRRRRRASRRAVREVHPAGAQIGRQRAGRRRRATSAATIRPSARSIFGARGAPRRRLLGVPVVQRCGGDGTLREHPLAVERAREGPRARRRRVAGVQKALVETVARDDAERASPSRRRRRWRSTGLRGALELGIGCSRARALRVVQEQRTVIEGGDTARSDALCAPSDASGARLSPPKIPPLGARGRAAEARRGSAVLVGGWRRLPLAHEPRQRRGERAAHGSRFLTSKRARTCGARGVRASRARPTR